MEVSGFNEFQPVSDWGDPPDSVSSIPDSERGRLKQIREKAVRAREKIRTAYDHPSTQGTMGGGLLVTGGLLAGVAILAFGYYHLAGVGSIKIATFNIPIDDTTGAMLLTYSASAVLAGVSHLARAKVNSRQGALKQEIKDLKLQQETLATKIKNGDYSKASVNSLREQHLLLLKTNNEKLQNITKRFNHHKVRRLIRASRIGGIVLGSGLLLFCLFHLYGMVSGTGKVGNFKLFASVELTIAVLAYGITMVQDAITGSAKNLQSRKEEEVQAELDKLIAIRKALVEELTQKLNGEKITQTAAEKIALLDAAPPPKPNIALRAIRKVGTEIDKPSAWAQAYKLLIISGLGFSIFGAFALGYHLHNGTASLSLLNQSIPITPLASGTIIVTGVGMSYSGFTGLKDESSRAERNERRAMENSLKTKLVSQRVKPATQNQQFATELHDIGILYQKADPGSIARTAPKASKALGVVSMLGGGALLVVCLAQAIALKQGVDSFSVLGLSLQHSPFAILLFGCSAVDFVLIGHEFYRSGTEKKRTLRQKDLKHRVEHEELKSLTHQVNSALLNKE